MTILIARRNTIRGLFFQETHQSGIIRAVTMYALSWTRSSSEWFVPCYPLLMILNKIPSNYY